MTVDASDSSVCNKGEGGSRSSISNLSDASCKKASRFEVVQKKGCDRIVSQLGLPVGLVSRDNLPCYY